MSVYVCLFVMACVQEDLGAWELCANHIRLPLAHLRVMGNNSDQKQQGLYTLQLATAIILFGKDIQHQLQLLNAEYALLT